MPVAPKCKQCGKRSWEPCGCAAAVPHMPNPMAQSSVTSSATKAKRVESDAELPVEGRVNRLDRAIRHATSGDTGEIMPNAHRAASEPVPTGKFARQRRWAAAHPEQVRASARERQRRRRAKRAEAKPVVDKASMTDTAHPTDTD